MKRTFFVMCFALAGCGAYQQTPTNQPAEGLSNNVEVTSLSDSTIIEGVITPWDPVINGERTWGSTETYLSQKIAAITKAAQNEQSSVQFDEVAIGIGDLLGTDIFVEGQTRSSSTMAANGRINDDNSFSLELPTSRASLSSVLVRTVKRLSYAVLKSDGTTQPHCFLFLGKATARATAGSDLPVQVVVRDFATEITAYRCATPAPDLLWLDMGSDAER